MSSPSPSNRSPWRSPKIAPKRGVILADFGWPWPVVAIWDSLMGEWSIAQIAPHAEGESIGWETEWEKGSAMKGWLPLPKLPNRKANSNYPEQLCDLHPQKSKKITPLNPAASSVDPGV